MKTQEEVKTELLSVVQEFYALVEKLMDQGTDFTAAVMAVCKARPDLLERENSLRNHLKALGHIEQTLSAADLRAWSERRTAGATISCAAVTRLIFAAARLPIAQLGVRYKGKEKISITRQMLAEVVANFRKRDTGQVPIDYEHAILEAAGTGVPVPAAGWIKSIDDAPDAQGILWGSVQWTPRAAEMIQAGEYKYISPVIDPNVRDNKTGAPQGWTLTSAALTNQPVLQGMPALVLSDRGAVTRPGEERNMNDFSTSGYSDQGSPIELEITRRIQQMMAANKQLDWAAAENEVYRLDPSLAGKMWDAISVEINQRVKALMASNSSLTYARALQGVTIADSGLNRRWQAARIRYLGSGDGGFSRPVDPSKGEVDLEIQSLVNAKLSASEGRMDHVAAFKAVLSEQPDLARRYQDRFRTRPR